MLDLRRWCTTSLECSVRLEKCRKSEMSWNGPSQNETLLYLVGMVLISTERRTRFKMQHVQIPRTLVSYIRVLTNRKLDLGYICVSQLGFAGYFPLTPPLPNLKLLFLCTPVPTIYRRCHLWNKLLHFHIVDSYSSLCLYYFYFQYFIFFKYFVQVSTTFAGTSGRAV